MPQSTGKKKSRRKAMILGVGLDTDGHKRITTGENFALVGGTSETHEVMTEKVKVADEVIREHPYESMGVAFGLGLLLGVIASRGRD